MSKAVKKGLGRGLDALLGEFSAQPERDLQKLPVNQIDPNREQPRKQFDEEKLAELADSLRRHGMMQPIIVRKTGERYAIVAGERRYRAARKAGLSEVPVIVREVEDAEIMEIALIENLQREDLNPVEEAAAIRFLMQQHDLTQEEVAERISKSRPAIANALRLLGLPEPVQKFLREGKLSAGHARALAALKDETALLRIAKETIERGYSVRHVEELVKAALSEKKPAPRREKRVLPELFAAQETLRERLKTRVRIDGNEKKGRIVIEYYSSGDLERIYDLIGSER
ncbi:MAG: ParB/RepB/Spo0J family partition protein [Bacillota bacterium]